MAGARVTKVALEVLTLPTTAKARVTKAALEVLALPTTAKARVTKVALEVLYVESVAVPSVDSFHQDQMQLLPDTRVQYLPLS